MDNREIIEYIKKSKEVSIKTENDKNRKQAEKYRDFLDSVLSVMNENRALKNRCYVSTGGTLCVFCGFECNSRLVSFREGTIE